MPKRRTRTSGTAFRRSSRSGGRRPTVTCTASCAASRSGRCSRRLVDGETMDRTGRGRATHRVLPDMSQRQRAGEARPRSGARNPTGTDENRRRGREAPATHPAASANPRRRPRRGVEWGLPATPQEGKQMSKQGPRVRVRDSKGNAIPGLYRRDDKFIAGFQENGRWRMVTLKATSLTEAKRERASLVVGLREGRIASADSSTFAEVFAEWQPGRTITERTAEHERHLVRPAPRHVQGPEGAEDHRLRRSPRPPLDAGRRATPAGPAPAVYRIRKGVFSLAVRRGILTRNPADGLTPTPSGRSRRTRRRSSAWTAQHSGS